MSAEDCGKGSWVKTSKPGGMPKDIGDITSLPRKGGMTGLGRG